MKTYTLLLLLVLTAAITANAQGTKIPARERVVVDSTGMQYPYAVWKKMVETKEYKLKKIDRHSDSSAYLLVKLDSGQVDRRLSRMSKPGESIYFKEGEQISLFNATDISGYKLRKKELAGKIVVLNFWFMGCPPCRKEFPELNKLSLQYSGDPNVVFIAVSIDRMGVPDFIKDHPLAYHVIEDGRDYADQFKIHLYPTNLVVDQSGKVRFHSSGYRANTAYWIKKTIEEAKAKS